MHVALAILSLLAASLSVISSSAAEGLLFDKEEMAKARQELIRSHGDSLNYLLIAERLEYHLGEGDDGALAEIQGWFGTDYDRFWFKTDAEYLLDSGEAEELEVQALYSRSISPFFDLQAGLRHSTDPGPSRTFGVLGVQGLAQYWFEIDLAYFLSEEAESFFRTEFEVDLLLSQRLILQPRLELNAAVEDNRDRGMGAGLSDFDLGLRLRYEFLREIAPYIGVTWSQQVGRSRAYAREEGEHVSLVSFVAGVRVWF